VIQFEAQKIGKKYNNEWIFREFSAQFKPASPIAITGPNGSGKSTLMKVLANHIPQNTGTLTYFYKEKELEPALIYKKIGFAAPYTELIEEFTLTELIKFHADFKPLKANLSVQSFLEILELEKHKNKQIKFFSSGMKQKLKLGLGFFDSSSVLFLDEPTANLDQNACSWYKREVQKCITEKNIIIASNDIKEYDFCENTINILNYKSKS
jgi:ABC-type multidrug transport system ATPase subunit